MEQMGTRYFLADPGPTAGAGVEARVLEPRRRGTYALYICYRVIAGGRCGIPGDVPAVHFDPPGPGLLEGDDALIQGLVRDVSGPGEVHGRGDRHLFALECKTDATAL